MIDPNIESLYCWTVVRSIENPDPKVMAGLNRTHTGIASLLLVNIWIIELGPKNFHFLRIHEFKKCFQVVNHI